MVVPCEHIAGGNTTHKGHRIPISFFNGKENGSLRSSVFIIPDRNSAWNRQAFRIRYTFIVYIHLLCEQFPISFVIHIMAGETVASIMKFEILAVHMRGVDNIAQ